MDIIKNNTVDFLGINQYYPKRIKAPRYEWNKNTPFHPEMYYENFDLPGRRMNSSRGWEIYPKIMYDMAMYIKNNYGKYFDKLKDEFSDTNYYNELIRECANLRIYQKQDIKKPKPAIY